MRTEGHLLPENLQKTLTERYRHELFLRWRFFVGGIGLFLLGKAAYDTLLRDEPAAFKSILLPVIIACLLFLWVGCSAAHAAKALKRVRSGAFTYQIGTVQSRARKKNSNEEVQGYELCIDGQTVACSFGEYRSALEGDRYALIFFDKEKPVDLLQIDQGKKDFVRNERDGAELSDSMRQKLLKKCRNKLLTMPLFLIFTVGTALILGHAAASMDAGILVCFLVGTLGMGIFLLMAVFLSILMVQTSIYYRRIKTGMFTYHIGTLKETDRTTETTHDEDGASTSTTYHLTIDIWDFTCSSKEYYGAKIGDLYAVIFFGRERPWGFLKM